jgi:nucleotide-binding universal stress UspA family protein
MGSHGRTGLDFVLMGSVAAAVARHSDRPVLIAHAPTEENGGDPTPP